MKTAIPLLKKKHPSRCHSYEKKKNETKLSVIWRKQIKSMKKQQLTFNPYHPKLDEGQQQLKLFVSVLKKSKTCLIWSKMGYSWWCFRLHGKHKETLKGSVPPKSGISLEPTKLGPKRKGFLHLSCHWRKTKTAISAAWRSSVI